MVTTLNIEYHRRRHSTGLVLLHYENTPIQIYWNFYKPKKKKKKKKKKKENFQIKKSDIFIFLLKIYIVGTR